MGWSLSVWKLIVYFIRLRLSRIFQMFPPDIPPNSSRPVPFSIIKNGWAPFPQELPPHTHIEQLSRTAQTPPPIFSAHTWSLISVLFLSLLFLVTRVLATNDFFVFCPPVNPFPLMSSGRLQGFPFAS